MVPFAKDGSCFHPGLIRAKGTYLVGGKTDRKTFKTFVAGLDYLKSMRTARWWRPSVNGNSGTVTAVKGDRLPAEFAALFVPAKPHLSLILI